MPPRLQKKKQTKHSGRSQDFYKIPQMFLTDLIPIHAVVSVMQSRWLDNKNYPIIQRNKSDDARRSFLSSQSAAKICKEVTRKQQVRGSGAVS